MVEQQLAPIVSAILENIQTAQENSIIEKKKRRSKGAYEIHSLSLGEHFRCLFYDNATLNVKSTMLEKQRHTKTKDAKSQNGTPVSNDVLLQLLELQEDFERYTSSPFVPNLWVG